MLILCAACDRHHFATEACPFCAANRRPSSDLARKALSFAAGAVVLGTFGCAYGSPEPYCPDVGARDPGCPAVDGGTNADAGADASEIDAGADATK
jgi:hypothetical protein